VRRSSIPILLVSVMVACTSNASPPPGSSSFSSVYESGGTIFVSGANGSPQALTRGYLPTGSPDRTMIAFLRDPLDPQHHKGGDPYLLQVWLIHPDGSGLHLLGQQRKCCLGTSPHLEWSPDGSSIVLTARYEQRLDVPTD
jgi:Tol biopolymer transport system component